MILTNTETIPGKKIVEHFGVIFGSTIRARNINADLAAGLKNMVGGELRSYTDFLNECRKEAIQRMIQQAEKLGANAIINVRFSTASIAQGAAEISVYGTAVRVDSLTAPIQ